MAEAEALKFKLPLMVLRLVIMWASLLLADFSGSSAYLGKVLAPVSISGGDFLFLPLTK